MGTIVTRKVLHVFSATHRGGAETMIMNLYRNIDRSNLQFDFVSHKFDKSDYDDEILELGGNIYRINSLKKSGPIKYVRDLVRVIKENGPYVAVHSHTNIQGGVVAFAAWLAGVKMRICHSHNTRWDSKNRLLYKIYAYLLKKMIAIFATDYLACGRDAAISMFGKRNFLSGKVKVLNNAIDIEMFNGEVGCDVNQLKKDLNVPNDVMVLGHIGRFHDQKNHKFLIGFAKYLVKQKVNFIMLLVGEGELKTEIEQTVKSENLTDYVKLLGVREDIPALMNMFDVFLLPSLYEGLPVVLIEAQATGTPCIISSSITDEVDLGLGLIEKVELDNSYDKWYKAIIRAMQKSIPSDTKIRECIRKKGYDVKENANKIMNYYLNGNQNIL
ncbi:glycosyltransferase family 1 protein [Geobacillus proteiniphilus]|uniref:Glycosyltransferase family 1 protein n=1 Tax=Geobacillus proteiniphilus TaxID=860353 RepID=A0ABY9ME97_9BACL|nr:glycosyltransferase family 1 protein [Geobacillus proteiniphilus]WMJ16351.1 glycosyltransferase family 1 protein [Geobacillus proteiniphilus]